MCRQSSAISHSGPALVRLQMAWRTLYPAGSCFAPSLPRHGKQQQAGFEQWVTLWARTHPPTQPHPILVRPPSAPNGLTRRGITSKNTFHTGCRDAIAAGLCLSSPMETLVFAAMPALYGGGGLVSPQATFTRVARVVHAYYAFKTWSPLRPQLLGN